MKLSKKELFSIPNCLSYIRLMLIPLFMHFYINASGIKDYYKAGLIVLISGLTDIADGYIARRYRLATDFGRILDPVADKLTQGAIFLCLLYRYLSLWPLALLFLIKELSMAIIGIVLFRRGKKLSGAMWFGKLCTLVFYICMLILLAFPNLAQQARVALMLIIGLFLLLSFILYSRIFYRMYKSL